MQVNKKIHTKEIGKKYERLAENFLKKTNDIQIISKNVFISKYEIDIIAFSKKNNIFIFIEVRFRKNTFYGGAISSISSKKIHNFKKAGISYLLKMGYNPEMVAYRFDAITFDNLTNNPIWTKNI